MTEALSQQTEYQHLRRAVEDYLLECWKGSPASQRMARNKLRRLVGVSVESTITMGARKRRAMQRIKS